MSSSAASSWRSSAVDDELVDQAREPGLERGDVLLDRARAGAHLQDGAGEEASTGKGVSRQMFEEGVAHGDDLSESWRRGQRGLDDLGSKDPFGFVDGGELQLLLRTEVGVDAALAHAERPGQVADRETFQSVQRRQRHRLAHDRLSSAFPIGAQLPFNGHLDKIARSVVLSIQHERSCFLVARAAGTRTGLERSQVRTPGGTMAVHRNDGSTMVVEAPAPRRPPAARSRASRSMSGGCPGESGFVDGARSSSSMPSP